MTASDAIMQMRETASELTDCLRRVVTCRMRLGQLGLEIQRSQLFADHSFKFTAKLNGSWFEFGPWKTWSDFAEHGFVRLTGFGDRTLYDCIGMAQSPALSSLPPEELEKLNLSSARQIAIMERAGVPITAEIIEKGQRLPPAEFRQQTGASEGMCVRVWVGNQDTGRELQAITFALRHADAGALHAFREILEDKTISAYAPGGTNVLDFILGFLATASKHEMERILEEMAQR